MAADDKWRTEPIGPRGPTQAPLAVEEAHLTVLEGRGAGSAVPCGSRPVRIGSAHDNDLVIPDPAVSRYHAVLEPRGDRLVLKDLGSRNGTFLGDVQIREAFVHAGGLIRVARSTLAVTLLPRRLELAPSASDRFGLLVGTSRKMRQLFTLLEWVAPTPATLLVTGPTGCGKEMVARSVHEASPRRTAPFVVLDCGAVEPSILSSELFGHEAGAFTGATARRAGVFEAAQGGTVFIDELGELPLDLQPKLLRVLEAREVRRLGGNRTTSIDVRVIAATNRPLPEMIAAGRFREDLYYRLAQVKVALPPLDERREDVPLLVETILAARGAGYRISTEALSLLSGCAFPGNVRQLRNLVERALMLARGQPIEPVHVLALGEDLLPHAAAAAASGAPATPRDERERLIAALEAHDFNLGRTARMLGIALNTLKRRMHAEGIPRKR